jgi:hypothetical protein
MYLWDEVDRLGYANTLLYEEIRGGHQTVRRPALKASA